MHGKKPWRMNKKELKYIRQAIESRLDGSMNQRLEEKFAGKFGVKYAIGVNSGTSTLHCALAAMNVKKDDEVIVPPLTYASTAFSALYLGGVPVFVDIDPDTFNIDQNKIEEKITPRTKVIMPVAIFGLPSDMDAVMKIAKENNLYVLEDSAECYLGMCNGKISGTIGDMGSFSLERSKHITCGDGGMIITNNEELAEKARKFSVLGFSSLKATRKDSKLSKDELQDPNFNRHMFVSPNYSLPELCAAAALAQLERLEEFVKKRIEIGKIYSEAIEGCNWLVPQKTPKGYINSYWTFAMMLKSDKISWHQFRKAYMEEGGDRFYGCFKLNYMEPALLGMKFKKNNIKYEKGLCPIAEKIQPKLILLKTDYMDLEYAKQQGNSLKRTIERLNG